MKHYTTILFLLIAQLSVFSNDLNLGNPDDLIIETITFPSGDGLINVTADTYIENLNLEFVLLCHQAGFSRGEYIEIAPRLVELGFNCMAIDQRSGNQVNGVVNQTAIDAANAGIGQSFANAIPDIEAAIDKAYELNNNNPIYLLGSSYSSSLSLIIGRDNPKVKAVLAFSPGEFISGFNVSQIVTSYAKPVFATSSLSEANGITNLLSGINSSFLTQFIPTVAGRHGASTLWSSTNGNEQYWTALEQFLLSVLSTNQNTLLDFAIYPNPTKDILFIDAESIQKIEIINILGKKILSTTANNQIDLTTYKKGLYYIRVYTENGSGISKFLLE